MADTNSAELPGLDAPATSAFPICPADTDLPDVPRALFVGSGGAVVAVLVDDDQPVTFMNLPAGMLLPVRVKRITAGTTASGLLGLL